jgi:hypothetical protein
VRTNSHRRLPLQASVRRSPKPIIAGGHKPASAPFDCDRFRRQRRGRRKVRLPWVLEWCRHAPLLLMSLPFRSPSAGGRTYIWIRCWGETAFFIAAPPASATDCTAALCMLQRDMKLNVACALRIGASRLLQGSAQVARPTDQIKSHATRDMHGPAKACLLAPSKLSLPGCAPAYCWSMIFSENRYPPRIKSGAGFFGIMLLVRGRLPRPQCHGLP